MLEGIVLNLRHAAFHLVLAMVVLLLGALFALGFDFVLWAIHVSRLEDVRRPKTDALETIPNVPTTTLKRLGRIFTAKKNSFINFDPRKEPGIIRIGAFGDSFTYGDEVDDSSDYPAQLQKLLRDAGISNVEVLNFGSSWYSFGQTHIMWNEVGKLFDPDYVLLGPTTFHPERETRFNHTNGLSPYYLHSRYVLDGGDGLRLIDVPGDSYSERFRNYYRFIPSSQVLRYDRSDPAFLAAALPEGRQIGNPFYYEGRSEFDEAVEIQKRLFQDMRNSAKPILAAVYSDDAPVIQVTSQLINRNFCIAVLDRPMHFPYMAPWGHNSPTGNALLARQYLPALLKRQIDASILHTEDLDRQAPLPSVTGELSSYDGIRIKLGGIEAGVFSPTFPLRSKQRPPSKPPSFLRDDGIRSLLAFKSPGSSVLDGIFLALRSDVPTSTPVRIVVQSANGSQSADLRNLRPLAEGLKLTQADLPGLEVRNYEVVINASDLGLLIGDISSDARLAVMVGDITVLEGSASGETGIFAIRPVGAELLVARGAASGDLAAESEAEDGKIDLELVRGTERHSIPIAQWLIERRTLDPPGECSALPAIPFWTRKIP